LLALVPAGYLLKVACLDVFCDGQTLPVALFCARFPGRMCALFAWLMKPALQFYQQRVMLFWKPDI
jgi:hypothetical protein